MKYVVLVSHGEFAKGLANALSMLAGEKKEVIAVGLENGKTADEFAEVFKEACDRLEKAPDFELAVHDLIKEYATDHQKDNMDKEMLPQAVLGEAHEALKEFKLASEDDDEEDDI